MTAHATYDPCLELVISTLAGWLKQGDPQKPRGPDRAEFDRIASDQADSAIELARLPVF